MAITAYNIYHSILLRAADLWGVEYDDVERDIGQQFDPIVRFLAGACSSELERVYQNIHDTEGRLQERLARVLLPEYFHLPQPAHALATATASADPVTLDESSSLIRELGDKKGDIGFSPLFPTQILPATLKLMATPDRLLDADQRAAMPRGGATKSERVSRFILGIELKTPISNWKGACLYFDLRGRSTDESEKARFFAAVSKSRCLLNGREMKIESGLPSTQILLEDYLNGNERLHSRIRARYERHFLTFQEANAPSGEGMKATDFLPRWFESQRMSEAEIEKQTAKIDKNLKQPLVWLEIQLDRPVEVSQLASRLIVRLNVFPVVNRRLCGNGNGEHFFLQTNAIKWVHLQPKDSFVAIRRVYEEKLPDNQVFTFKPFADFKEESKPSYTLRLGGVGRWDDFNAWKRMAYLVSILQENYGHAELIQKAASALSLEDIHHLLGKKIEETSAEKKPTTDIYVLLHTGITSGMRVRVEYWTSIGSAANGIAAKTALKCTAKVSADLDSDSIELISVTEEGQDPLESTEQLDAMKSALLSRGRIVTREDVKTFCKVHLRERLAEVSVSDGVGTDPRLDFGMTRRLHVQLLPATSAIKEDWEAICRQLETLLEQKSSSNVPIHVSLSANIPIGYA